MKNGGWGCGILAIIAMFFIVGFVMDQAAQETQVQSETAPMVTIDKLADSNSQMAVAIQQNGETIHELAGEVVEQSKGTRAENKELLGQNKMLIYVIGGLVAALILAMMLRRDRGPGRATAD